MSNYTKSTNFAAKDSLPSGNAGKVVKGTEINTEFDNIATAIATKADLNSPTLVTPNLGTPSVAVLTNATGLPLTTGVTGTLLVANGGTGTNTFSAGALLKGAGTSAITTATAGTDYAAATTGTSAQLLANNGSGGFSNVTVGSGLSLSAGTLSTTGGASISAGDSNVTVSDTGSNGTVTVQTDGTERMRIDSSGNVGIGTSSPDRPLVVYSATTAGQNPWNGSQANLYDSRAMAAGVGGTLQLTGNYTTGGANALMAWVRASKKTATSGDYDGDLLLGARNGDIKLYTAASPTIDGTNQVFTVKTGGTVILNGGSASATGVGITFPATQSASSDANTLDDYEEGTWTPSIAGTTTAGTASYVVREANYTKIGNLVYFSLFIDYTSGTGTGNTKITGLPFSSSSSNVDINPCTVNVRYLTYTGDQVIAYTEQSSSAIVIAQQSAANYGEFALPYDSGANFGVSGFYQV